MLHPDFDANNRIFFPPTLSFIEMQNHGNVHIHRGNYSQKVCIHNRLFSINFFSSTQQSYTIMMSTHFSEVKCLPLDMFLLLFGAHSGDGVCGCVIFDFISSVSFVCFFTIRVIRKQIKAEKLHPTTIPPSVIKVLINKQQTMDILSCQFLLLLESLIVQLNRTCSMVKFGS